MAKICPQCEKENPNAANVCMYCGTRLVEDAEMEKVDKLHSDLSDAKETIKVLRDALKEKEEKKALTDTQQNNDSSIENLQKRLEILQETEESTKSKTIETIPLKPQSKVVTVPEERVEMPPIPPKTKKSNENKRRFVLVPLLFVLAVLVISLGIYMFYESRNERVIEADRQRYNELIKEQKQQQQGENNRIEAQSQQPVKNSNIESAATNANTINEALTKPDRDAYINGTSVTLRVSYSTTSNRVATLNQGEKVKILDSYYPTNTNEAICKSPIKLYSNDGSHVFTLQKGKAVQITNRNGNQCDVSFTHPQYGNMTATIYQSDLESISGDKWYKIQRDTGETGWVFSKFVTQY